MTRSKGRFLFVTGLAAAAFSAPQKASANDDFGKIVHHIETQYHVHRQHRFAMGMAGFVVKFWHFAGVKSLKGAIFENQPFVNAASDTRFDEVVRAAMDSGWQPMVQSWDRHTGERTYIYAQRPGQGFKVLAVILESDEAMVIQVKVNPDKARRVHQGGWRGRRHRDRTMPARRSPATERRQSRGSSLSHPNLGRCLPILAGRAATGG